MTASEASGSFPRVLYVGPYDLTADVQLATIHNMFRAFYDAIEPVVDRLYLLTGAVEPAVVNEMQALYPKLTLVQARSPMHHGLGRPFHIFRGWRLVSREQISVVTNYSAAISYGFDATVIGKATGARVVVRVSNNEIAARRFAGIYRGVLGRIKYLADLIRQWIAVRFSDAVIVNSVVQQRRIQHILRHQDKVFCCPFGISVNSFNHPVPNDTNPDRRVVLFVGRNSLEKGFDIALEAAELLQNRTDITFKIAGDFPPAQVGNVEFLGYVDPRQLGDVYRSADLLVMPSRTEGFPFVLLQAWAAGLPVVASPVVTEILPSSGHGVMMSENTPDALAKSVIYLMDNPGELRRRGRLGREFVAQHYDRDVMSRRYRAVLLGTDDQ